MRAMFSGCTVARGWSGRKPVAIVARMTSTAQTFIKMHGAGNDFVVIDSRHHAGGVMTSALARAIGDRHRGVGFDQLAELRAADDADLTLDFWNADGSRAGACGNATRCVAAMVMGQTGAQKTDHPHRARATAGRKPRRANLGQYGCAGAGLAQHSASACRAIHCICPCPATRQGWAWATRIACSSWQMQTQPLWQSMAPKSNMTRFSRKQPMSNSRRWLPPTTCACGCGERGTGITLACGSGACATAIAAHLRGLTGRQVTITADGGALMVDWREDGVWLTRARRHGFHRDAGRRIRRMSAPRFTTLGCRLNAYETEAMKRLAEDAGVRDALVVNTCAVTSEAVRKARQEIRRLRRDNPDAPIIVTGCAAQTEPETFAAMPEVTRVIGNAEKNAGRGHGPA